MDDIGTDSPLVDALRRMTRPLSEEDDYADLLGFIGEARFVLLGEASHGTHEFYRERARITQQLVLHKGFTAIAIEGDWPDAYRVNRFVQGLGDDGFAVDALAGFQRFPTWMWRNVEVVDFVEWLAAHNTARPAADRVGFYGLDLFSLHASMAAVLHYLDQRDPEAACQVRQRYACFEQYGADTQLYGLLAGLRGAHDCEAEMVAALVELRRRAANERRTQDKDEDAFDAEQNARLVRNAESYYRTMYRSDVSSWNLRDRHMAETLGEIEQHLSRKSRPPKIVVWAHNSHLGDARATDMGRRRGEVNLGQLVRERHGHDAVLLGFTTHTGTVTAASDWGGPARRLEVLPSRADSHERLMHALEVERFLLLLRGSDASARLLRQPRLERAIGVIYRPETERLSHYFHATLPQQFDALIHLDKTRALEPLETSPHWREDLVPETYPKGL